MAKALYKQIYENLRDNILSGNLADGERMPSKRALAEEYAVSVVTVLNAYDRLIAEGYITSKPRRGYFVSFPREKLKMIKRAEQVHSEAKKDCWQFDFKSVAAAEEGFPFSSWAKLMREVLAEKNSELLCAPSSKGVTELRHEIARLLTITRGLHPSPEQIIIGAGSDYLINLVYQLLGSQSYAVEDPGYTKAARIYENLGAAVSYIPTDSEGIRIDGLEQCSPAVLHVVPSHSFPTGIVTSPKRRSELISWVNACEGRYIIEDDFENEFCYSGRQHACLSTMDTSGRVIYMNSFTRTLAPSMRIGYIVLPESLLPLFEERLSHCSSTVPTLEQYLLARFIADGSFERHVHRMRMIYRRRRDRLVLALSREFGDRIRVVGQDVGVHVLGELRGLSAEKVREAAKRASILLPSLSDYCHGECEKDALVFNFAGMRDDDIDFAIARLASELKETE